MAQRSKKLIKHKVQLCASFNVLSASAVIGTSSDLNNYFNGGSVYNNKSAQTIEKFISVWKKQFTNLIDYGMNWTSTFNKLDMTIGKLDRHRQKLLNVKRNYLEKTSV